MPLEFDISTEALMISEKLAVRDKLVAEELDLLGRLQDVRFRLQETEDIINTNVNAIRSKK